MDKKIFSQVIPTVIDNLEGGYFHRNMLLDGRLKDPKGLMSKGEGRQDSGETMYGLDRVHGADLFKGESGKEFWSIIDKSGAKDKWKWNYKGGDLAPKLKSLVAEIMFPAYDRLSKAYLSESARKLVDLDPRLSLHFAYATWNGAGFFKRFAQPINDAVAKGTTNLDSLAKIASDSRTLSSNSLIKQGGLKVEKLMSSMKKFASESVETIKTNPIPTALIVAFFFVAGYIGYTKLIKNK